MLREACGDIPPMENGDLMQELPLCGERDDIVPVRDADLMEELFHLEAGLDVVQKVLLFTYHKGRGRMRKERSSIIGRNKKKRQHTNVDFCESVVDSLLLVAASESLLEERQEQLEAVTTFHFLHELINGNSFRAY